MQSLICILWKCIKVDKEEGIILTHTSIRADSGDRGLPSSHTTKSDTSSTTPVHNIKKQSSETLQACISIMFTMRNR